MAGLGPVIHDFSWREKEAVDGLAEPGHDRYGVGGQEAPWRSNSR
jgi:hypothetical protein